MYHAFVNVWKIVDFRSNFRLMSAFLLYDVEWWLFFNLTVNLTLQEWQLSDYCRVSFLIPRKIWSPSFRAYQIVAVFSNFVDFLPDFAKAFSWQNEAFRHQNDEWPSASYATFNKTLSLYTDWHLSLSKIGTHRAPRRKATVCPHLRKMHIGAHMKEN